MRRQLLQQWCDQYFKQTVVLDALSGDASLRRYFRIQHLGQTFIVADAPPASEKNPEFVRIAQQLEAANILAPKVLSYNLEEGFLLLSDLGDQTLLPLLNAQTVDDFYTRSMQLISEVQQLETKDLAAYDRALLQQEMDLFPQWFIKELLGYELSLDESDMIQRCFDQLIDSSLEQPQVFVHRDYHSRNLMVVDGEIATIDFQDAVKGAMTYDLVSILRDCYIEWPQAQVSNWVNDYRQMAVDKQLLDASVSEATFQQWFDFMGLQRHIKVLGIFARLSLRDKKDGYLLDLPLVMKYTRNVLAMYPQNAELSALLSWFDAKLLPLAEQQAWIKGRA